MDPAIWSVLFLILMLVAVGLEVFTPSFGLLTCLGVIFVVGSVIMAFKSSPTMGFVMFTANFALFPLVLWTAVRFLRDSKLTHTDVIRPGPVREARPRSGTDRRSEWVGRTGRAVTPLRPAGVALFGDDRIEVLADGTFVEAGQRVQVVRLNGKYIVVERAEGEACPEAQAQEGS